MNYKYHEVEIKLDSTMKSLLDNWREMIDEKLKNIIVENEETLMKVFDIFKDKFKDEFDFVDSEE